MEDFRPWSQTQAVQDFYRLLAVLNGRDSPLETNDSAFNEPAPNTSTAFAKRLQSSGRLMILFRDLILNTRRSRVRWLERRLQESLTELDRGFPWTAVATAMAPTRFIHLPPSRQTGWQLAIHFFAWGDTAEETLDHFGRIVRCLAQALPDIATEIVRARAVWLADLSSDHDREPEA
jgi:hypothetical protein